jgi:pyruvate dehydrogenase E1 component beta subunit
MEHMNLYRSFRGEVPEGEYTVPIGKANVVREGTDVTILTYGAMVHTSLKAAEEIEKQKGTKVEVIDLRTLLPLDMETIVASIKKTNRVIVVQEAQRMAGAAPELIAQINERAILHLEAPVIRVAGPDTVYPFAQIEDDWLPNAARIIDGLNQVLDF